MHINDILDPVDLAEAIADRLVNVREDNGVRVYNYSKTAQIRQAWNPVTCVTRGLVTDTEGTILARPMRKFFDLSQTESIYGLKVTYDDAAVVMDKLDGSLGIIYPKVDGTGYAVSTRGSSVSEMAVHASEWLDSNMPDFAPDEGVTYLVEIIYPDNRIVVDYQDRDELVLIGGVNISDGSWVHPHTLNWSGSKVDMESHLTVGSALSAALSESVSGSESEGFVLYLPEHGELVKVKRADYLALHRARFNFTPVTAWSAMMHGQNPEDIIAALPDEFYKEAIAMVDTIRGSYDRVIEELDRLIQVGNARKDAMHADGVERKLIFPEITALIEDSTIIPGLEQMATSAVMRGSDAQYVANHKVTSLKLWGLVRPQGFDLSEV